MGFHNTLSIVILLNESHKYVKTNSAYKIECMRSKSSTYFIDVYMNGKKKGIFINRKKITTNYG